MKPTPSRHVRLHLPLAQRGFSLIELVAAFVVFALGFGVLMQILSGSIRNTYQAADYTQAALMAQSKLDVIGIGEKLQPGHESGRFDDQFRWELDITRYEAPDSPPDLQSVTAIELYRIDLEVLWGSMRHPRSAHFVTLRSAQADMSGNPGGGVGGAVTPAGTGSTSRGATQAGNRSTKDPTR
ncbi:type IV pilus modification PilV family protein [Tahibacter amnicola]|uniref:Prepilin-type N-terminal cleavage/methylation domain-containing protein n=1 Tax=Tahibacter amnicola TaxID=2976241 RepID=A0ABY6BCM0_9GAMM|nr:prepilin-type N-terminal cleavage/methylation domain-containing protein [Tahibacter amnicola]UXI67788.1 prepilin-type N-terminal cleavage/methylation domain-containing protein [Tahibacter amnicola]